MMDIDQQAAPSQAQPAAPTTDIANTVLDLNPTAFVDDLCNSVWL